MQGVIIMKQTNLRLPEEIVIWLKQMAKKKHQSMNAFVLTEFEKLKKEYQHEIE